MKNFLRVLFLAQLLGALICNLLPNNDKKFTDPEGVLATFVGLLVLLSASFVLLLFILGVVLKNG